MLKKLLLICWISILIGMPHPALAQTDAEEIIVVAFDGDFWSWSAATGLLRLTDWGYNWGLDRSPDGRYIAYASTADFVVEAYERHDYYSMEITPTNIWLYDLATNKAQQIAAQPPDAVYSRDDLIGYARYGPRWSPDGTKLAWIQLAAGVANDGWQLVVYDIQAGVERMVADDLPGPFGDAGLVGLIDLQWASIGLITDTFGGTADNFFGQTLRIYDEAGTRLAEQHVRKIDRLRNWFWSDAESATGIVGLGIVPETGAQGYWLIDPLAATEQALPEQAAVIVARTAPNQLALYLDDNPSTPTAHWWQLKEGSPTELTGHYGLPNQIAISPDGQRIAYITDALYIWQDGQAQRIAATEALMSSESIVTLIWGDPLWQLIPRNTLPFIIE